MFTLAELERHSVEFILPPRPSGLLIKPHLKILQLFYGDNVKQRDFFRILDPPLCPEPYQHLMDSILVHVSSFHQVYWKT